MKVTNVPGFCVVIFFFNCSNLQSDAIEIKVTDFGAIPDDGKNDSPAIFSAIKMKVDLTTWWESTGSRDVIIRNNRFVNCRFEPSVVNGVIESLTNPGNQPAPAGVHQNITIENNIIQGTDGNALEICSANGVVIASNIIDRPESEAILLTKSRNIRITGNNLTNKLGLNIGEGYDPSTIKAENNIGF